MARPPRARLKCARATGDARRRLSDARRKAEIEEEPPEHNALRSALS